MSVTIKYINGKQNKPSSNTVLFCDENYKINNIKKFLNNSEFTYINDLLKTVDIKKKLICF